MFYPSGLPVILFSSFLSALAPPESGPLSLMCFGLSHRLGKPLLEDHLRAEALQL